MKQGYESLTLSQGGLYSPPPPPACQLALFKAHSGMFIWNADIKDAWNTEGNSRTYQMFQSCFDVRCFSATQEHISSTADPDTDTLTHTYTHTVRDTHPVPHI